MAAPNRYILGEPVRLSATFTVAGVATNPATVTVKVKDPAGVVTTISTAPVNDGTGQYHVDYTPALKGEHVYRWEGTGACVAAAEEIFFVASRVL